MTNAATNKLKMAPISKPSITPMPTAKPARVTLSQRRGDDSSAKTARARKLKPKQIGCEATPQQAVEKKSEFSAAAKAPKMQAAGASLHWRKQNQAQRPTNRMAAGA